MHIRASITKPLIEIHAPLMETTLQFELRKEVEKIKHYKNYMAQSQMWRLTGQLTDLSEVRILQRGAKMSKKCC